LEALLYLKIMKLIKRSAELNHQKWYRNFEEGIIKVEDQKYTLRPKNNKAGGRELIIKNNKIINTSPYIIKGYAGKELNNDQSIIECSPVRSRKFAEKDIKMINKTKRCASVYYHNKF